MRKRSRCKEAVRGTPFPSFLKGRPLRSLPVANFREEPDCRAACPTKVRVGWFFNDANHPVTLYPMKFAMQEFHEASVPPLLEKEGKINRERIPLHHYSTTPFLLQHQIRLQNFFFNLAVNLIDIVGI